MRLGRFGPFASAFAALLFMATTVRAAEWTDTQGNRVRGEPTEILGPFALFRTHLRGGQRVLLRGLPTATCEQLYRELAKRPPLQARWSEARGAATAPLVGHAFRVVNRRLAPVDFTTLPEPELLLVVAGANNAESWPMVDNLRPLHQRMQRVLHGRCATVFVGTPQPQEMYNQFAIASSMPWLVADHRSLSALGPISSFIPPDGTLLLLMSREGTPLLSAVASDFAAIRRFTDEVLTLLWAINPDNPRMWPDRANYARAVRPLECAQASAGPLLIGNPLQPDALRRRGVNRVTARVAVGVDGVPTSVVTDPANALPAKLGAAIADALRRHAVFAPAIANGLPVAGSYDYVLDVPSDDPVAAADAAWLGGHARIELPIPAWFVLKPIHVPEADFGGEVDHVDATGKVILKSFEVTEGRISRQAQLSAFHTDWFADAGAGSVRPVEGTVQPVDNDRPVWHRVVPIDGLVDFATGMGNCDYCVGYAWTEIDVPMDLEAWLGIGSDDGLKLWHNGTLVVDRWVRRPSRIDEDIVPLRLKKGKNQLLVKIQNVTIQWSFVCRLRVREP